MGTSEWTVVQGGRLLCLYFFFEMIVSFFHFCFASVVLVIATNHHVVGSDILDYHDFLQTLYHTPHFAQPSIKSEYLKDRLLNDDANVWKTLLTGSKKHDLYGNAVSNECNESITEVITGIKYGQYWALQMLDASAKIDS